MNDNVRHNLFFLHFKALVPNALYSVLFLVDKEVAAKPDRDVSVQVIKKKKSFCCSVGLNCLNVIKRANKEIQIILSSSILLDFDLCNSLSSDL